MTSEPQNRCAHWAPLLVAFADGGLEAGEHAAVAAHLAACDECRDALAREEEFAATLRARWAVPVPAPEALRARVASIVDAPPLAPRERPAWLRALGSPWGPRLAMAAVLVLAVLVPFLWRGGPVPALATTAAAQHACHGLAPGAPLPPCCTALAVGVGDALGPPSPGVRVPDLRAAALGLAGATRCTFALAPVNLMSYEDGTGGRFSLYITDRSTREFKTLRAERRGGVTQSRVVVRGGADQVPYAVTVWQRDGCVWTWVGPESSPASAAALGILQSTP